MSDAEPVVQRQLDAYNARDLERWLSTYAVDAKQYELHGGLLASGHEEMRKRMAGRFQEPNLHAKLLRRSVMGNIVVDHELVTRTFPDGQGTIEMLCIYEVHSGAITKATFALGPRVREASAQQGVAADAPALRAGVPSGASRPRRR